MKNREFYLPTAFNAVLTLVLSVAAFYFNIKAGIICLALGTATIIIFTIYNTKRLREIQLLNNYLDLVLSGDYDLAPKQNSEGEISILQNNILKVVTALQTQNEVIKKDKTYLADSLADISHQLKTPLTSMLVASELLENEEDKEKQEEFIGIINNGCEKMNRLIQTLLKLSKLDTGTVTFAKDEISVQELIDESLRPFLVTLDIRNIHLIKNINDFTLTVDQTWTAEALQNIIKNCIEHTQDGGKLEISSDETAIFKRITIKDSGCGISKEDLPHIFERFYRGKNSSDDSVGIGLALSKSVLEKQNASVTVRSEENKGSEFQIKFYKSII